MKTAATATIGAALLWSSCVTNQEAHADDHQTFLLPLHSCTSDPDVPHMVVASNDDDCDDSDPTWLPAPPTDVLFDISAKGFVIEFAQPRSLGLLFTDDCDDGDPSWMPAPPFSAIVTIGQNGGRAWELQDEMQSRVIDIIKHSISPSTYSPEETGGTVSFPITESGRYQQEIQKMLNQLSENNAFIDRALEDGHIPYLFLRSRGN